MNGSRTTGRWNHGAVAVGRWLPVARSIGIRSAFACLLAAIGADRVVAQPFMRDVGGESSDTGSSVVNQSSSSPVIFPVDPQASIGVTMSVQVHRWQAPGYHWIEVTLQSAAPLTADRKFQLRLNTSPTGSLPPSKGTWVETDWVFPQGERKVARTLHLPCYCLPIGLEIELIENGVVPEGYSDVIPNPELDRRMPLARLFDRAAQFDVLSLDEDSDLESLDWRAMESHDMVRLMPGVIDRIDASTLGDTLVDYLLCGGTVWLPGEVTVDGFAKQIGVRSLATRQNLEAVGRAAEPLQYDLRSVGAGMIVRFSESSPLPVAATLSATIPLRGAPVLRRGVEPMMGDPRFFQWTVPGVAQPPVYTFIGLLTAFVVLVGPIAYRRTTKHGRGYLIFAIAPILALMTTTAMFAYGILADGFGTQARVRQLTYVDGESGNAGERIRAAYFAGIRPQSGMRFDENSMVFPYPDSTGNSWESLMRQPPALMRLIDVGDSFQRFGPSFLPSRRQQGFVTTRPRRSIGRLRFDSANRQATSEFGFDLRRLVIRDHEGKTWLLDELPAGAQSKCRLPEKVNEASSQLGSMYNEYWLTSDIRQTRRRAVVNDREVRDLIANLNPKVGSTSVVVDGLFEDYLIDMMKNNPALPLGTFVGMSDVSEDAVAVPGTQLRASVRYVFGTLPR